MKTFKADLVLNAGAELAEGPLWHEEEQKLYWVNINVGELHRFDPVTGKDESFSCAEPIGTIALRKDGGLIGALKSGIYLLDFENGALKKQKLADPEPNTPNRFNDGKCDPVGRLLAGTCYTSLPDGERIDGGFYSVEPDGSYKTLLTGISISNGLCFSADHQTLYYIDSLNYAVTAYDYNLTDGSLANPRTVVEIPKEIGLPDGMTIDENDNLWIALFKGSKVICASPKTGEILAEALLPASKVTCPVFGGPDFSTLYITTAWENDTPEERKKNSLGGALFAIHPGVKGFPSFRFGK